MIVKAINKKEVEKCITCPLCTNIFDQPTTISECLHTFCKNCIVEKFITEKLKACPICNVDLGVDPHSKLRQDCTIESIKQKILAAKVDIVEEGTETVKQKEQSIPSLEASSSEVPLQPKPMITFSKRRRKANKNVTIMEPAQPHREPTPRLDIDLNKIPEDEEDTEVTPLNINVTPLEIIAEPEIITPNGRGNQDNVVTSGVDAEEVSGEKPEEECVQDVHSYCVINRQVEEIPLEVYQIPNFILINSDADTKEVSGEKLMKSKGKGKQVSASSSSRKKPGRKSKKNGGENQECFTPRSGKFSGAKKTHYSPPTLRPRKDGKTINSAERTSQVKKMNLAAAKSLEARIMNLGAGTSEVKPMSSGAGTSEVKPMSSGAGTSEVRVMSSGAGTSEVTPMRAGTSEVRIMSSGAGTSEVKPMSSGAGTSEVRVMSSGAGTSEVTPMRAGTSEVRIMSSGAGTSEVRFMSSGAGTSEVRSMNSGAGTSEAGTSGAGTSGAGTSGAGISLVAENSVEGRNLSLWFQLIASGSTDRPLPQLSSSYLRVSNRNMTVSYVKKYLVKKLDLKSEDQVEIWLRHEPVSSTLTLHDLVEWWVLTAAADDRKSVMVGSSAADFVMILYYSFKEAS